MSVEVLAVPEAGRDDDPAVSFASGTELGHGTIDRFQIGKGVITRLYIVILFAEYIM